MAVERNRTKVIAGLISWSLVVAGCVQSRPATTSVPRTVVETVAFTSEKTRTAAVDAATSNLVASNFSITLANDRIGLVQTDFIPVGLVREALVDTISSSVPYLDDLLMRVAVNAERTDGTTFVQLKGSFQRISGRNSGSDSVIGLYWLERVAGRMADDMGVEYRRQLPDSAYAHVVRNLASESDSDNRGSLGRAARAGGIVLAVVFAVTLMLGTFGPSSGSEPIPQ